MITLITGTPGAGKTLYAISNLLRGLVGSTVSGVDDAGNSIKVQRVIYTNINGLLIDHVLIDGRNDGGLANWHTWAKPGAVICFDEVQREWPPRPNGSKIPDFISALETHRHMGVDFIILTQNPMLLDQNVRALVGRHIHVRRLGGAAFAVAYEWDHCSRALLYSKSLKKAPFRYDKSVFKLYKSAELHTKPKTSIPTLVYVVALALVAAAFLIPNVVSRISGKSDLAKSTVPLPSSSPSLPSGGSVLPSTAKGYDASSFVPVVHNLPLSAPAYDDLRVVVNMPQVSGAACFKGVCKCYTQQGTNSGLTHEECKEWMDNPPFDNYRSQVTALASASSDTALVSTQRTKEKTSSVPSETLSTLPPVSGASNPRADARQPSMLPPGSPFHTTPATDAGRPIAPPTLLNSSRNS